MRIAEAQWQRAVELLGSCPKPALACHVDPDGDAIGSMLALSRFLTQRGCDVVASFGVPLGAPAGSPTVVPPQYTFLPGVSDLVPARDFPEAPDVLVAFDTAASARLGTLAPAVERAGAVLVLDHHARGSAFGDVQLVDGEAAATAVVVDELIRRMGGELDREMAICLYVGLITDTARFTTPSTTPQVHELAARLIAHDIDHEGISRRVWETRSFGYLKVLGRAMRRAALVPEAGLAWTAVLRSDLDDLGVTLAETEGLIDVLRGVEAAEVSLVLKDAGGGRWKASLRGRGDVDVGALAMRLGGGGHAFAAGFTAEGDLDGVVNRVVTVLVDEHDALAPALVRAGGT